MEVKEFENGVEIAFDKNEALVLFEHLATSNKKLNPFDSAENIILSRLEACFEKVLTEPFKSNYLELVESSRKTIKKSV